MQLVVYLLLRTYILKKSFRINYFQKVFFYQCSLVSFICQDYFTAVYVTVVPTVIQFIPFVFRQLVGHLAFCVLNFNYVLPFLQLNDSLRLCICKLLNNSFILLLCSQQFIYCFILILKKKFYKVLLSETFLLLLISQFYSLLCSYCFLTILILS